MNDITKLLQAVSANTALYSIFDRIYLKEGDGKLNNWHKPRPLTKDNIVEGESISILEQLEREINLSSLTDETMSSNTFYYLLQKYGWRIGKPDNEEETNLTVAFCDAYRIEKAFESKGDDDTYILLKGDLSGIQKYIYGNIQPKRAGGLEKIAKKLRGRSVIVSLLTDFLANIFLKELKLPIWNLLFAGGGHFNLLIPKTADIEKWIDIFTEDIDKEMRRRFGDSLQLVIAQQPFKREIIEKNIGSCLSVLNAEIEKQKFRQHHTYLHDHFFLNKTIDKEFEKKIGDWETEIGKEFPNCDRIIEVITERQVIEEEKNFPFIASFEMHNYTHKLLVAYGEEQARKQIQKIKGVISAQVFCINNTDFLPKTGGWQKNISFGFRFMGKNVPQTPDEKNDGYRPKDFEEIVKYTGLFYKDGDPIEDQNKLLAALRLDVDDLGFIFSHGIDNGKASLGEIMTLSREIQYFFSAHFDKLAKEHEIYLIYSGGDDAFAVGKWDNTIKFTAQLHKDFKKFVFDNSYKDEEQRKKEILSTIHFSAGIFMGNPHYPVGRFYQDAGRLQDEAKDSNERKNRISVFNHVLDWEEFHSKIDLGETFAEALAGADRNQKQLNSAFMYRILSLVKSSFHHRTVIKDGEKYRRGSIHIERFARNVAGLRYLFARHGYDQKIAEQQVGKIEKALIGDFLRSFNFSNDDTINSTRDYLVAFNYAIFKQRAKTKIKPQNHE
jgi:CRISPR-associated protein Csm1